jgi:hypothetical protein
MEALLFVISLEQDLSLMRGKSRENVIRVSAFPKLWNKGVKDGLIRGIKDVGVK